MMALNSNGHNVAPGPCAPGYNRLTLHPNPESTQARTSECAAFRATTVFNVLAMLLLTLTATILTGCGDTEKGGGDFNDIIPKLMEKANGPNPEATATELFDTTTPDARRYAIEQLSRKKWGLQGVYLKAYRVLATDPDDMVRSQAVAACGKSKDPSVADIVIAGTRDKAAVVRIAATQALVDWKLPASVDSLMDRLKIDTVSQVRVNCAKALTGYPSAKVYRALIDALDDQDVAVVHFAWNSLKYTSNLDMPKDSKVWLTWYDQKFGNKS